MTVGDVPAAVLPTVAIEGLDQEGRGVGHLGGRIVLVPGALPGEKVRFRRTSRKRSHDEGVAEATEAASPERVRPRCEHFGVCGGCSLQHLNAESQIELKLQWLLGSLRRIGGVEPENVLPPLLGPRWGYRRKARLAVMYDNRRGRAIVGFHGRNVPRIAEIHQCEVLQSDVASLFAPLADLIGRLTVRRHIPQIEVAVGESQRALCFRMLAAPSENDSIKLREFAREHRFGVFVHADGTDGPRSLAGADGELHYELGDYGVSIAFSPIHFVQVNGDINRSMVSLALDLLRPKPTDRVLDLFCGLGNFTLPVSTRAASVVGVDGDRTLISWARRNADRNNIGNAAFHAADLTAEPHGAAWIRGPYDSVILDPPRTGALGALPHVADTGAERILYLSCDPRTLARDAGYLVRERGYRLERAGVIDMFPHTSHVESVALLRRTWPTSVR